MTSPYATGGTIIEGSYLGDAGYLHVFDTVGGGNFVPLYVLNCTVVVIGGGGAGGASEGSSGSQTSGGGGGAGGYGLVNFPTIDPLSVANYAITVGAGGTSSTSAGNSSFTADPLLPPPVPLMVAGGGAQGGNGVDGNTATAPTTGDNNYTGSGGGAGSTENNGNTQTNGGSGATDGGNSENEPGTGPANAGGGGGMIASGQAGSTAPGGMGGAGTPNPFSAFTGQDANIGGGGGGGTAASIINAGSGGGGNGGSFGVDATNGTTYGSGGGGGYAVNTTPGQGYKGAVMIFYPTPAPADPVTGLAILESLWNEQTISWLAPAVVDSYEIYVTSNPLNYGTPITSVSPSALTFTANTASVGFPYLPDTIYYFRVVVLVDGKPNSAPSDINGATDDPPAPTAFTVSVNNSTSQTLTWTPPPLPLPNSYNFYVTTNPGNYGTPTSLGSGASTRTVTGLTPGTLYYYRIRSVYIVNSISFSSLAVDTSATTPTPPATGLYYKPLQIRSPVGRGSDNYPGRHPGRGLPATQTLWMSSL